jgi:hypothetical protein
VKVHYAQCCKLTEELELISALPCKNKETVLSTA